jgi:hypothetical protein
MKIRERERVKSRILTLWHFYFIFENSKFLRRLSTHYCVEIFKKSGKTKVVCTL